MNRKNVIRIANRKIDQYEELFQNEYLRQPNEIDYAFETFNSMLEAISKWLDKNSECIVSLYDSIQEVSEDQDTSNIIEKLHMKYFQHRLYRRYDKILAETRKLGLLEEKIKRIVRKLCIFKAYR